MAGRSGKRMGKKNKEFNSVVIFKNQIEALLSLTSLKDVRTILSAIVAYGMNGEDVTVPPHLEFGWIMIKNQIDSVRDNYSQKVEKCRNAGLESANKRQRMLTDANGCQQMFTDVNYNKNKIENKNVPTINVGDINSAPAWSFPKTADEIVKIAAETGLVMPEDEAEMYLADRQSKGWKPNGHDKAMNSYSQVKWDVRKWCLRSDNDQKEKEAKEKKFEERRKYADGKHLPGINEYGESDEV
jgi:hypothetical protein